jgi:FAD/FMN-containing dehydrogenase
MPNTETVGVPGVPGVPGVLAAVESTLGADKVVSDPRKIRRYLRDFSWYSPILESAFADTAVDAVIKPASLDELTAVVALAARARVPLTMRGAGTGNYGQSLPLKRGLVVDIRGVVGVLNIEEGRICVLPGTIMKTADDASRTTGQELAVMPSTYRVATASGFICGGSGGLGAAQNGDIWSDNILAVEILTVEEQPRTIRLEGDDVRAILHTYGTIGVVTRIEMRLRPARVYKASIITFPDFRDAVRFGWKLVDSPVHLRLASIQQAPLGSMFTPIADLYAATDHLALVWSDIADHAGLAELAAADGGQVIEWP